MVAGMSTGVPRGPRRVEPAAPVGEDDRAASGGGRGPERVDDGPHAMALVEVRAGAEDQRPPARVPKLHGADRAGVTGDRGRTETGDLAVVEGRGGRPEQLGGLAPPRSEDERDVVVGYARSRGDDRCRSGGDLSGVYSGVGEIRGRAALVIPRTLRRAVGGRPGPARAGARAASGVGWMTS